MRRLHPNRLSPLDIERDLLSADRIFQRWARSVGCDLPPEEWDGVAAKPMGLPEDAAVWVDQYVCKRPDRMRRFLHAWYRGQDASAVIAKRFNVGRDEVYTLWRACLALARTDFAREPCVSRLMIQQLEAA